MLIRKVMMENLPGFFVAGTIFVFGLLIGSFLNVVIYRLPQRLSIVFPSSRCPACDVAIRPYDNVPVLSYVMLGGKCRGCKMAISPVYPAVELLVAVLYLSLYLVDGLTLRLLADIVFVSLIVPLVFIDLRHKLLPNAITYPGFVIMILLRLALGWPDWGAALASAALGAAVGGGSLWLVREAYFRLRRIEGMGLGDVKMMLMVGAYLGWQRTLLTIFVASLLGSLIGIMLIWLRGGNMKMEIPFGVFLGPAAIIALVVGNPLLAWYTGMFK